MRKLAESAQRKNKPLHDELLSHDFEVDEVAAPGGHENLALIAGGHVDLAGGWGFELAIHLQGDRVDQSHPRGGHLNDLVVDDISGEEGLLIRGETLDFCLLQILPSYCEEAGLTDKGHCQ